MIAAAIEVSLVMGVRCSVLIQQKQLSKVFKREVTLHILLLVHHTAAQSFLMSLSLEYLLLDGSSLGV